jgi:hypothetical protein
MRGSEVRILSAAPCRHRDRLFRPDGGEWITVKRLTGRELKDYTDGMIVILIDDDTLDKDRILKCLRRLAEERGVAPYP